MSKNLTTIVQHLGFQVNIKPKKTYIFPIVMLMRIIIIIVVM